MEERTDSDAQHFLVGKSRSLICLALLKQQCLQSNNDHTINQKPEVYLERHYQNGVRDEANHGDVQDTEY